MPRVQQFVYDCQTQITETLKVADAWAALKAEYDAMTANGALPTQTDIDAVFGAGVITQAQFNAALGGQQEVIDYIHVATRAAKLYRVRR